MNRKIREMINISQAQLPVTLEDGTSVYVQPGGTLRNVVVANLPSIKKFFKVTEDLNEVGAAPKPGTPKVQIVEEKIKTVPEAKKDAKPAK